jgi:hypothetical protein
MVNTLVLASNPMYRLCSLHYDEAVARNLHAQTALERLEARKGMWETPSVPKPPSKGRKRLAAIMREKEMAARQDLLERDAGRREWLGYSRDKS